MLAHKIRSFLLEHYRPRMIRDLRVGSIYAGVLLDDGSAGVAYRLSPILAEPTAPIFEERSLPAETLTHALLPGLGSSNTVEAAMALATANALVNRETHPTATSREVLDLLNLSKRDRMAMVGFFRPLVEEARRRVGELLIFEQARDLGPDVLPATAAYEALPRCDVALITSTALVNNTIDALLGAAQSCREMVLLGPSTLMLPEVFAQAGVTMLSGVVVTHPTEVLTAISEGGGMRSFKGLIRKVNLRLCKR